MSDPTKQQLQQAYEYIKAKQRQQAIDLLLPILRDDENNVNAWWLLANAVTEPNDSREALQNVLRLRPDHANAQKMLDELNRRYPPPAEESFGDFGGDDAFSGFGAASPAAPPSDPFGAPAQPFGGSAQSFGAPAQSFGGSAQSFGAPADSSSADPFGAPSGGSRAKRSDDPFGAPAAPAGGFVGGPSSAARRPTSSGGGNRTLVIVLAVIGGLAVCAIVACLCVTVALPAAGIAFLGGVVTQTGTDLEGFAATLEAGALTAQAGGSFNFGGGNGQALPGSVIGRGNINFGESRQDRLNGAEMHGWTFSGNGGDTVVIELLARDDSTDPTLELYGPQNTQIGYNDDGGDGYNSLLTLTLPSSGTYTIVARTFGGGGGPYELRLNRQ